MPMKTGFNKKYIRYIPFVALSVIALCLGCMAQWHSDAVFYKFVVPIDQETDPSQPIMAVSDIFQSQYNHYFSCNGRFFIHFIVQLFCGILGKYVFAACNAVVWFLLPLAVTRISCGKDFSLRTALTVSTLIFLLFMSLNFDPPFQINYLWTSLMFCGWIMVFFGDKRRDGIGFILLFGVFSFLFGNANESFSIPVGAALIFYAVLKKFRLSTLQWVSAVSFGFGAIVLIVAPGNWIKFGDVDGSAFGLSNIEQILPAFLFPVIWLLSVLVKGEHRDRGLFGRFLLAVAVVCYLLCLYLKGCSGFRMFISGNLCLILLALPSIVRCKSIRWINLGLVLICGCFLWVRAGEISRAANAIDAMYSGYAKSQDGIVYIPDDQFVTIGRHYMFSKGTFIADASFRYPGKPDMRLRPASMRYLPVDRDTNIVVRISDNAWLLLQSTENPRDFIVEKTLLPGLLNKRMADRQLDFDKQADITFETLSHSRAAIYVNTRPAILNAQVTLKQP